MPPSSSAPSPFPTGFKDASPDHTFPDLLSVAADKDEKSTTGTGGGVSTSTVGGGSASSVSSSSSAAHASASASGADMSLGYGSFHQRYFLDDRLIAVAVIDVLPHCLSSVYVFYDPSLPLLELGKLTALREIQWVQRAMQASPRLKYYYMGFYVHSCPKMRYKAEYAPSDLLCPRTRIWVPLADAVPLLDADKYAVLVDGVSKEDAAEEEKARAARIAGMISGIGFCVGRVSAGEMMVPSDLTPASKAHVSRLLADLFTRMDEALAQRIIPYFN